MNEPANFGTNEDKPWNWPEDVTPEWSLKCPTGHLDDPPYKPSKYKSSFIEMALCYLVLTISIIFNLINKKYIYLLFIQFSSFQLI